MNVGRGGALTALVLLMAMGCGGSDSAALPNEDGGNGNENVVEMGPDGGTTDRSPPPSPPPPPPSVGGEPPNGVFVSASKGLAGADGAMTRPVKTIAEGLALAVKQHLPVNVCAETYTESVTLADGITMFGYYDCSNLEKWRRGSTNAKIASPTSPAVVGEKLLLPATFAGFDVEAPDIAGTAASGPAASSYGMILRSSKNLAISNSSIRAGKGQDGADGAEPTETNDGSTSAPGKDSQAPAWMCFAMPTDPPAIRCTSETSRQGSAGGESQCKIGPNGGGGGRGGGGIITDNGIVRHTFVPPEHGAKGFSWADDDPSTAKGGVPVVGKVGEGKGKDGAPGSDGSTGTHGSWSFTLAGFVPGDGKAGTNGLPGQGGGGGAGSYTYGWFDAPDGKGGHVLQKLKAPDGIWGSAFGAGGGAGGCGGIAGGAGKGGGASIGLFVVDSKDITIAASRIEGKKGGAAGEGAAGTSGTAGGKGGARGPNRDGYPSGAEGGSGGKGGHAGLSGHGAPGWSIALLIKGDRPLTTKVTLLPGLPGDGVSARTIEAQTQAATVGEAKQEHSF